ncbi:MAG: hypothetical protein ACR2PL_05660 [Dehalococcoidia bacterium]
MADDKEAWPESERAAFWSSVRGRMGELRLTHTEVADAVGFERSTFTRRLSGNTGARPDLAHARRIGAGAAA